MIANAYLDWDRRGTAPRRLQLSSFGNCEFFYVSLRTATERVLVVIKSHIKPRRSYVIMYLVKFLLPQRKGKVKVTLKLITILIIVSVENYIFDNP